MVAEGQEASAVTDYILKVISELVHRVYHWYFVLLDGSTLELIFVSSDFRTRILRRHHGWGRDATRNLWRTKETRDHRYDVVTIYLVSLPLFLQHIRNY